MSFIRNLRETTRIASTNPYVATYIQNAAVDVSKIPAVSRIPGDVPLETLVALSTFQPTIIPGTVVQTTSQNTQQIQNLVNARLRQSNINTAALSNFRPSIGGNAIQRRTNNVTRLLNSRQAVIRGIDPKTQQLVRNLQDLRQLQQLQQRLNLLAGRLEQEITRFTAIFNAIVNAPDAAISAALTEIINKLDLAERAYTAAKNLLIAVVKALNNTRRAIQKALFEDIPKGAARIRTGLDALNKILKLPEIKLRIQFPKRPKLPRLNFSIPDFYQKFKKQLEILKKKNGVFYQKAYDMAVQQSGIEIVDPKKDKVQQGLTKARNSLKQLRAQFIAKQAVRNEAINKARTQLINNIRRSTQVTERERARIMNQASSAQARARRFAQRAQNRLADLASRRLYLTPDEQRMIVPRSQINIERTNVLGDLPFARPITLGGTTVAGIVPGTALQTGYTTPDGRTVYKDRRTDKLYVLQSPQERVAELTATSTNRLRANVAEFNTTLNAVNTAIATAAEVKATMNNNVIKAQFGISLLEQAQAANDVTQQARAQAQATQEESTVRLTTNAQADANVVFENDEFSIDRQTQTITSKTRRLSAARATNEATNYNTRTAASNGYTIPLTINASGPRRIEVNGQAVYELTLIIRYRDFNPLNSVRLAQLGQAQSTVVLPQVSPPISITGLPISTQ